MNNIRRKEIREIETELLKLAERIEFVLDEEQESFDNLPEGLQCAEKGDHMQDCINQLSMVFDEIETQASELISITE